MEKNTITKLLAVASLPLLLISCEKEENTWKNPVYIKSDQNNLTCQ